MTTIVTRTNKTTELLYAEGDANLNLDVIAASVDPGIGLESNRSTYECTSTFNFTLPLASSMISPTPGSTAKCNDYRVTIKNAGSGTITVKTTSTDTLDGVAATGDQAILPNEAFEYQVNFGKDGWISTSKVSASALSAAAVITTNALVKGSDGTRSVKESGIIVDASDNTSGVGTLGCGNITSTGTIGGTTITASASFSGAGTNLSGTASSLTAGSATTAAAVTNGGALNTPASGTLTNCTGLPIIAGTTGTLTVARGGTGSTTAAAARLALGFASGNHQFTAVSSSLVEIDIDTGLATDNLIFGLTYDINGVATNLNVALKDKNGYVINVCEEGIVVGLTGITTPSVTGHLTLGLLSTAVGSNTFNINWWAQIRD